METLLFGLVPVVIGVGLCFGGYRFFRILVPLWAFWAGLVIGAAAQAALVGEAFLSRPGGWIVGLVTAVVLAAVAILYYDAAVAALGGTVGYLIAIGVMAWIGGYPAPSFVGALLTIIVGAVVAATVVEIIFLLGTPKRALVVLSALAGASALLMGLLVLNGQLPTQTVRFGSVGATLNVAWFWPLAWLAVAALGTFVQLESTRAYTLDPELYPM